MASYTPGPWETDDHETYWAILSASNDQHIADVRMFNSRMSPLLYESLKKAAKALSADTSESSMCEQIRAALAAAEGTK